MEYSEAMEYLQVAELLFVRHGSRVQPAVLESKRPTLPKKKYNITQNVQLCFTTGTQTGTPEPFRKKMQTCNRGMVSVVPGEKKKQDFEKTRKSAPVCISSKT
jgi:hypothetical protein